LKLSNTQCIADNFTDKYEELFNSVSYMYSEFGNISAIIEERVDSYCGMSADKVADGVARMKVNKNDVYAGLLTNYFKFASFELYTVTRTVSLFEACLCTAMYT